MSSTEIAVIVVGVLAVLALAAAWLLFRRQSLRRRFGPEYDRAVAERDSRRAAEQELRERERRHAELELHPLSEQAQARYATAWAEVQARFVDAPKEAVAAGDELVTRLVAERGYPTGDYDEQVAHLSVDHARTLGHYRDAHDLYLRSQRGEAGTEDLRRALVHYRALFADLLGEDPVGQAGPPGTDRTEPDRPDTDRHTTNSPDTDRHTTNSPDTDRHTTNSADTDRHTTNSPAAARTAPQDANRP